MNVSFDLDSSRLICHLSDGSVAATATSADAGDAAAEFLAALQNARDSGLGECFWHEQGGDYRWMFCRHGDRVEVALMWCEGVVTGWRHVFRAECALEQLVADSHREFGRLVARMS